VLIVLSPAKTLDFETETGTSRFTQPDFLDESAEFIAVLRKLKPTQIAKLMDLSDELAQLNVGRYQRWSRPFDAKNAKQAVLAFRGDVYMGLRADLLTDEDLDFAQAHVRILSGLYGVLRPLDLMQAYRLEMGTKLVTARGANLYSFWGERIAAALATALAAQGDDVLVNLASKEYWQSVKRSALGAARVIEVEFKDRKNDTYKVVSFFAKKARGMMARFVIENQLTHPEDLKGFAERGYRFGKKESKPNQLVFLRDKPEPEPELPEE
jgi:cytoplasmic iron level regulating protein YaaA (DUF328/UPF0246 family)